MFPKVPHFISVIVRGNAVPVNHAKISQKFSFIEILELSDFNIRAYCIQHSRAKMSNFTGFFCVVGNLILQGTSKLLRRETGDDISNKGCFGRTTNLFRESGDFAGNWETWEIFREIWDIIGTCFNPFLKLRYYTQTRSGCPPSAVEEIEESRVFFDVRKKNFISETNITNLNWGYPSPSSARKRSLCHNLLIWESLRNETFLPCQGEGFPNL